MVREGRGGEEIIFLFISYLNFLPLLPPRYSVVTALVILLLSSTRITRLAGCVKLATKS